MGVSFLREVLVARSSLLLELGCSLDFDLDLRDRIVVELLTPEHTISWLPCSVACLLDLVWAVSFVRDRFVVLLSFDTYFLKNDFFFFLLTYGFCSCLYCCNNNPYASLYLLSASSSSPRSGLVYSLPFCIFCWLFLYLFIGLDPY